MPDISLAGFSSVLESQLTEKAGALFAVAAGDKFKLNEGESTVVAITHPAGCEVMRIEYSQGYYIAAERALNRTTAQPHPIGACVTALPVEFDECQIVAKICRSDVALGGLFKCLDAHAGITSQFKALSESIIANDQEIAETGTALALLQTLVSQQSSSITEQISALTQQLVQAQSTAKNCCDENASSIVQLGQEMNSLTEVVQGLQTQITQLNQNWLNFDINNYLSEIDCDAFYGQCPPASTGGGDPDPDPEHQPAGTVVKQEGVNCICPAGTDLEGQSAGSFSITYTSNGDGSYTWGHTQLGANTITYGGGGQHPALLSQTNAGYATEADAIAFYDSVMAQTACEINDPSSACLGA